MDSPKPFPSLLVSPTELHAALTNPPSSQRIIPVAAGGKSLLSSFEAQHIPGSIFFNMDEVKDPSSPYPQMLPTPSHFAKSMADMGILPRDILVVYDALEVGLYSSPRVAWVCRFFGHRDVYVLNNFAAYVGEGLPLSSGVLRSPVTVTVVDTVSGPEQGEKVYPVRDPHNPAAVISFEELRGLILSEGGVAGRYQIVDARIPGRFAGVQAEMDPALRSGHMPSALNVPLASILGPDKRVLGAEELRAVFEGVGLDEMAPVVLTCNSGVTAAALDLALRVSGYRMERRLYDGSWMEWTRRAGDEGLVVVD